MLVAGVMSLLLIGLFENYLLVKFKDPKLDLVSSSIVNDVDSVSGK